MRTLIDLPDADIAALDRLSTRRRVSRSKVIREAVREFLNRAGADDAEVAFGLWRDRPVDGVEHQQRLRSEW